MNKVLTAVLLVLVLALLVGDMPTWVTLLVAGAIVGTAVAMLVRRRNWMDL